MASRAPALVYAVVALAFGLAFVFMTPPFQVPDEVGHYWHSYAIAGGGVLPRGSADKLELPQGARDLVALFWVAPGAHENFSERLRTARKMPPTDQRVTVKYHGFYAPLPYIPQAIACRAGEALHLRPIVTFYLGRIANLLASVAVMLVAIVLAGELAWVVCATGVLPMTLFLFASYSADALTIALACLATVLAQRQKRALAPVAFLLGLCKPPYLLIAALALTSKRRSAFIAVGAALLGAVLALPYEKGSPLPRADADPAAQTQRLIHDPLAAGSAVVRDLARNGGEYIDQMVGRFGWLDVRLPRVAFYLCVVMMLLVACTAGVRAAPRERLLAAAILIACVAFIEVSLFIFWTPTASDQVEGVQGRYWLPLVPLFFVAASWRIRKIAWVPAVVASVAAIANGSAIYAIVQRYFA